jgi:capsular polysaccharide transport system ATP-binding protein
VATIVLENVTKTYVTRGERRTVFDRVSLVIPPGRGVALLGKNGAGKSTLLRMIGGLSDPTDGRIRVTGNISFPIGFSGSFHPEMTGAQNTRFVARIYGVDTDELSDFVEHFAELGRYYHLPIRTYSSGMRGRLAFGVSMGIPFDTYLIDESTAVGDATFKRKAVAYFESRILRSGLVFASHSMGLIRRICDCGVVIDGGQLHYHEDVDDAVLHYADITRGS